MKRVEVMAHWKATATDMASGLTLAVAEKPPLLKMEDVYYNHPKVQQARRLLAEAYQDIRQQRCEEANALICRCSHRHDEHHPTYSHNYTAGSCRMKDCRCLGFVIAK